MKYYIVVNLSAITGYLTGYRSVLDQLFLKAYDGTYASWISDIEDAKKFATEEAAWEYAFIIWSTQFAYTEFSVMAVTEAAIHNNKKRVNNE